MRHVCPQRSLVVKLQHQPRVFFGYGLVIVMDQKSVHLMPRLAYRVKKMLKSGDDLLQRLFSGGGGYGSGTKMNLIHTFSEEPGKSPPSDATCYISHERLAFGIRQMNVRIRIAKQLFNAPKPSPISGPLNPQ